MKMKASRVRQFTTLFPGRAALETGDGFGDTKSLSNIRLSWFSHHKASQQPYRANWQRRSLLAGVLIYNQQLALMAYYQHSSRSVDSPFTLSRPVEYPQKLPRRLPPISSSRSLFGLEKVVLPTPLSDQPSYSSLDDTPQTSATGLKESFPQSPTRSRTSSDYSSGSGYTKIIDSYGDDEDISPMSTLLQPTATNAHQDTVAALIRHQDEVPLYTSASKIEDRNLRAPQSIPMLQYTIFRDERWNASAHELSQAPAFSEFRKSTHDAVSRISSGSWHHRTSYGFLSPPIVSPPLAILEHHPSYDHVRQRLPGPISAGVTELVDPQFLPQPLCMSKTASMVIDSQNYYLGPSSESFVRHGELLDIKEAQRRAAEAKQRDLQARAAELVDRKNEVHKSSLIDLAETQCRKACEKVRRTRAPYEDQTEPRPKSVSSDSFVIYTGLRESVKAIIMQKLKQKKDSRNIEKTAKVQERERKRVISIAEEQYPAKKNNPRAFQNPSRKYSWTGSSGRASITDGVSNLFRNLSVLKTQREEENNQGRGMERGRRPKQLAVLPSPYQKYGAEVWYAKNKKAQKNLLAKSGIQRAPAKKAGMSFVTQSDLGQKWPGMKKKRSEDVKEAYQQGAAHLRHVLGVDGAGGKEKQKKRHKPGFGMTMSEVRRERLKQSIAVIRPATQPVATQVDDQWV